MILCGRGARSESRGAETSSRGRSGRLVSSGPLLDMRAARGDQSPCRAGTSLHSPPRPSGPRPHRAHVPPGGHRPDAPAAPRGEGRLAGGRGRVGDPARVRGPRGAARRARRPLRSARRAHGLAAPPPRPARLRSRPRHRRAGELEERPRGEPVGRAAQVDPAPLRPPGTARSAAPRARGGPGGSGGGPPPRPPLHGAGRARHGRGDDSPRPGPLRRGTRRGVAHVVTALGRLTSGCAPPGGPWGSTLMARGALPAPRGAADRARGSCGGADRSLRGGRRRAAPGRGPDRRPSRRPARPPGIRGPPGRGKQPGRRPRRRGLRPRTRGRERRPPGAPHRRPGGSVPDRPLAPRGGRNVVVADPGQPWAGRSVEDVSVDDVLRSLTRRSSS